MGYVYLHLYKFIGSQIEQFQVLIHTDFLITSVFDWVALRCSLPILMDFNNMKISEEFITYYNKIEDHLKNSKNYDAYLPWRETISLIADQQNEIKRFKNELLSFGAIRNALDDSQQTGSTLVSEPHLSTLKRLKEIHDLITKPDKVIPAFKAEVYGTDINDSIKDVLISMVQNSYSQVPVYKDNKVEELINTNTISRWLSDNLKKHDTINIIDVKIKDLIPYIETKGNYRFVTKNTNVYDAYELFIGHLNENKWYLDALFITKSGKESENLLGLITIEDIVEYMKKLTIPS